MSDVLTELVPATRSLPAVLREAMSGDRVELLVGTVTATPDRAHVTVDIQGASVTIPKLSQYGAVVGEPCYIVTDTPRIVAVGTVSGAAPPTSPDLTVAGRITAGELQINGPANITGALTVGGDITAPGMTVGAHGLQVNGSAGATGNLGVSGQITGGGVRTTNNTIQATGSAISFFGRTPIGQPRADFSSDPAALAPRLWTALRDLGLIQNI